MTAYSFGARWVGIVALREPPKPEPLHKMAQRLDAATRARLIHIGNHVTLRADALLPSLARIRTRLAASGQSARAQECLRIERSVRGGQAPVIRPWLQAELVDTPAAKREVVPTAADSRPDKHSSPPDLRIVATGWANSYPHPPESPWIPPASETLLEDLRRMRIDLDEDALLWVRWACVHNSYLYESVPNSPVSAGVLDLLSMLGRGWMRLALLDRVRSQRGEFTSNAEVSEVLKEDRHVRSALAKWVIEADAASYGKGEASLLAAGSRSSAPETVAMQILGALSLVTASQKPADKLLELISFELRAVEPDWQSLLTAKFKRSLRFTRTDAGPDHSKTFTITVDAAGRTASATAGSVKSARRAAAREFVLRHLPEAVHASSTRKTVPARPLPYGDGLPDHNRVCGWAQRAFEVADAGLIAQALTHRSWVYEHQSLVAEAHQRDYGTLAAEGAEILTHLVRHSYALQVLNGSLKIPATAVTSPAVTRETVVELFERMPVAAGVLRVNGMTLVPEMKEDVTQAIAAAAWRANGDLLAERQVVALADWVTSFTPAPDHITQLQTYCSQAKVGYSIDFERTGPDHQQQYRATVTFDVEGTPSWRGNWQPGKTPAKQNAAAGALDYLLGQGQTSPTREVIEDGAIVRGLFLAELRAIDPERVRFPQEIAASRLGVDLLATGAYNQFSRWSSPRSSLLPTSGTAVVDRLSAYYEAVLRQQRRDAVRRWIVENTPVRGVQSTNAADRIRRWWSGNAPGRLALCDDLLAAIQRPDTAEAISQFVESRALSVAQAAGASLESERSRTPDSQTLTLRLSGVELSDALDPVVRLVETVVGNSTWARESQAISVTFANPPTAADLVLRAGMEAVSRALQDPWLLHIQQALKTFLSLAERHFDRNGDPTFAQLDELALAELSLILQLRSADDDDDEDE